jgi:hypothetical protein
MNSSNKNDSICPIVRMAKDLLNNWICESFLEYCKQSLKKAQQGSVCIADADDVVSSLFFHPSYKPSFLLNQMLQAQPLHGLCVRIIPEFLWYCILKSLPSGLVKEISNICDNSVAKKIASVGTADRRMIFYQLVAAVLNFDPNCNRGAFHVCDSAVLERNSSSLHWHLPYSERQRELIIPFEEPPVESAVTSQVDSFINSLLMHFFVENLTDYGNNKNQKIDFITRQVAKINSPDGFQRRFVFAVIPDTSRDFIDELNRILPSLPIVTKPTTMDLDLLDVRNDLKNITESLSSHQAH